MWEEESQGLCDFSGVRGPRKRKGLPRNWGRRADAGGTCFLLSLGHTSPTWKWKKVGGDHCLEQFKGLASVPTLYSHVYSRSIRGCLCPELGNAGQSGPCTTAQRPRRTRRPSSSCKSSEPRGQPLALCKSPSPEVCPWVSDYGWEHPEDRVRSLDSLLSKGSRASHHAAQSGAAPEK